MLSVIISLSAKSGKVPNTGCYGDQSLEPKAWQFL